MSRGPAAYRMRIDLDGMPAAPPWPAGTSLRHLEPAAAPAVHALLVHGYGNGGGAVAGYDAWLTALIGDEEFDPGLCFLVDDGDGLGAVAICWTSAFVKDLVVHERLRRRGIGSALLGHVFATFSLQGATAVELKVEASNAGAIALYQHAGMRIVESLPG